MKFFSKIDTTRVFILTTIIVAFIFLHQSLPGAITDRRESNGIIYLSAWFDRQVENIKIPWPDKKGVVIDLGTTLHKNYLNLVLSPNDTYKVEFITAGNKTESIYINTGVSLAEGQTQVNILHLIPAYISKTGYQKIGIFPVNGDGQYKIYNFSLDELTNPQPEEFPAYQIVDFEIKKFEIEIAPDDYQKMEAKRKAALELGILLSSDEDFVPAGIRAEGRNYKTEVRLKGDWVDHISTDKWSLRVEVKKGEAIYGMDKFSLQREETRNGIFEYLIHEYYREQGGVALRYDFADVVVNGVYKGVYAFEEGFDKLPIEYSKKRENVILKISEEHLWERLAYYERTPSIELWSNIEPFSQNKTLNSPLLDGQAKYGISLVDGLRTGDVDLGEAIDIDLYAKFAAVIDLFGAHHGYIWHNLRFYLNPVTGLLEPITFDNQAFTSDEYVYNKSNGAIPQVLKDEKYLKYYFSTLKNLSNGLAPFLKKQSRAIDIHQYTLRRDNPEYTLNLNMLMARQEKIQELFIDHGMSCFWSGNTPGQYQINIRNDNYYPTLIDAVTSNGQALKVPGQAFPIMLNYDQAQDVRQGIQVSPLKPLSDQDRIMLTYHLFDQAGTYQAVCEKLDYSFFVGGHTYGEPGVADGLHQPFLKYLQGTDLQNLAFGVLTGDFVGIGDEETYAQAFEQLSFLNKPIFAAPGNHDEANAGNELFIKAFGAKYYSYVQNNDLFLFLDPDDVTWSIPSEQIEFINREIASHPAVDQIFVMTHQLVWWETGDARFDYYKPNSLAGKTGTGNFWTEVAPIFNDLNMDIYFFAGDVGAFSTSKTVAFDQVDNLTLIASGMGGGVKDNLLMVNVVNGSVVIDLVSLNQDNRKSMGLLNTHTGTGAVK